jgi:hypothetical protein
MWPTRSGRTPGSSRRVRPAPRCVPARTVCPMARGRAFLPGGCCAMVSTLSHGRHGSRGHQKVSRSQWDRPTEGNFFSRRRGTLWHRQGRTKARIARSSGASVAVAAGAPMVAIVEPDWPAGLRLLASCGGIQAPGWRRPKGSSFAGEGQRPALRGNVLGAGGVGGQARKVNMKDNRVVYAALGDSMSIDDYAGGPGRGAGVHCGATAITTSQPGPAAT